MSSYLADLPADVRRRAARVRLLALDVDGTLTDGRITYSTSGDELKSFSVADGQGLVLLREAGIALALISARNSAVVERRARELGLAHVIQGCADKRLSLLGLCAALDTAPEQAAFMGDDLPDLPALGVAGLAVAPGDAHPWVRERVHWCTARQGGKGAVRELCDAILFAQSQLTAALHRYGAG